MDEIRPVSELRGEEYLPAPPRLDAALASGGVEWGTASLVFGAVFALMLPVALELCFEVGHGGVAGSDAVLAEAAGYFFGGLILMLSAAGVAFGILSVNAAQRARRPIALGLGGVMLNVLNVLMWAGSLLAWHSNW